MLGQTVILVAFVAIVATSLVSAVGGYVVAQGAARAHALVAPAIASALAQYETGVIAPAIANAANLGDGSTAPAANTALNGGAPWPVTQYVLAPDGNTVLRVIATITPTSTIVPACLPAGGAVNGGADVQTNGQCSPFVQESRLSVTITTTVGPSTGATTVAPLARDVAFATLRLTQQPPYVMLAGLRDDADRREGHEGDLGGFGNAVGAFGPADPSDTTIHVVYACVPTAGGDCTQSHPVPADAPTSLPWSNGNGNGG